MKVLNTAVPGSIFWQTFHFNLATAQQPLMTRVVLDSFSIA